MGASINDVHTDVQGVSQRWRLWTGGGWGGVGSMWTSTRKVIKKPAGDMLAEIWNKMVLDGDGVIAELLT